MRGTKTTKLRWAAVSTAATLLALSGCSKGGSGQGGPGGGFKMPPMPVEVAAVEQGTVSDRFEAVGTIEARDEITVVSEIDGLVEKLPFREGEAIESGGLIAQLDDTQLRAEEARAEALREQAQATYDRVKSVVEQSAGAPQDLDDAAGALKVAEANLALARSRLDKTRITAPWTGILGARRISPGAFLRAGQPITDLAAIDEIRVSFSAPERYLGVLARGTPVTVSAPAFPNYTLEGRIDVVEPVLDADSRSARILARVRNPGRKMRPGMSANIVTVLSERPNALTVPSEAIFVDGNQSYVFAIKPDSTVTRVPVQLGTRMSARVEVTSGLERDMRVVRAGHQKLFEGARVMPIASAPPGGAPGMPGGATGTGNAADPSGPARADSSTGAGT
jgi:membrane fusion protein, multidrug efflux system